MEKEHYSIMSYFRIFPKRINYPVTFVDQEGHQRDTTSNLSFQDIFRHAAIIAPSVETTLLYDTVEILDGERPDQLSSRLYDGNHNYYWTFFIINPKLRLGEIFQWPLSRKSLSTLLEESSYKNVVTHYNYEHTTEDNLAFKDFIIGEEVVGSISGYRANVKMIRVNYGQVFLSALKETEDSPEDAELFFDNGEEIVGVESGERLVVDSSTRFPDAVYKYFDELNGREINNSNFIEPSEEQLSIGMGHITFRENLEIKNDNLSVVKVLKKESIVRFVDVYTQAIRNGK